jgi:hypothetical protein
VKSTEDHPQTTPTTKSSLTAQQKLLVELMQRVNFGRIEALLVSDGEPNFNPAPRVVRKLKLGGENIPRPEIGSEDFQLKSQVVELLEAIRELGEGTVLAIDVKHGLPFVVELEVPSSIGQSRGGVRRG